MDKKKRKKKKEKKKKKKKKKVKTSHYKPLRAERQRHRFWSRQTYLTIADKGRKPAVVPAPMPSI